MRAILASIACLAVISTSASSQTRAPWVDGPPGLTASHEEAERWAAETLGQLTLEQRVAQMVCEQIQGTYASDDDPALRRWIGLARDRGIGGFVVYGGSPYETAALLNRLQREAKVPLLMSTDFEGGPGQQFGGASEFPGNMALSAIGSEELTYEVAKAGAQEGRAIGIHLNYSPVVDIQTLPANPVLSVRSFGSDLGLLARMTAAYIKGYQDNGMLTTAKHFPGRGDVELIAGTEFTINRKPAAQIEREEFRAFKSAFDAGVAFVMTEHIAIPSLTNGSDLPASVSRILATDILRDRLGFTGVLTSDDLWYAKIVDRFGAERAAVLAIQAGHDIVLKPANAEKTIDALIAAAKSGEIPVAQIDRSAKRVLYWKARLNLHRQRLVDLDKVRTTVGTAAHRALVQQVAERSLTLLANRGVFPTTSAKNGAIVHVVIQKNDVEPAAATAAAKMKDALGAQQTFVFKPGIDPALYRQAVTAARQAHTVVVSLFNQRTVYVDNGPLSADHQALVDALVQARPDRVIVMSYGNPYLATRITGAGAFVLGYGEGGFFGNQTAYVDAFVRLMKGEIEAKGVLPVKLASNTAPPQGRPAASAANASSHVVIPFLANASRPGDLDYQAGECDVDAKGTTMACEFQQVFLTVSGVDTQTCLVTTNRYARDFTKQSPTRWMSREGPEGACGIEDIATLDDNGGVRWTMEVRKVATRKDAACRDEQETLSWRDLRRPLPCTFVQPGAMSR